jgi:fatty-acid peroxygenase
MVEAFGGVGPRLWQGKLARAQAERWIEGVIEDARRVQILPGPDSALATMAQLKDDRGRLLPARIAAVELLNVLRPTVAISWYITFAALALHEHPEAQQKLVAEPVNMTAGEYADLFMHEVRRFYPFTPYLGAKVRSRFSWRGHDFTPGTMVFLDVYGSLHDPQVWRDPEAFRPERFLTWDGSAYNFAPQGGGDVRTGHRCPGEWITMHNVTLALHFLTRCMTYRVRPGQDLSFDLGRMPTRPRSGFEIEQVAATDQLLLPPPVRPSLAASRGNGAVRSETNAAAAMHA